MISKEIVPHSVILIQDLKIIEGPGSGRSYKKDIEFTVNCFLDKDGIDFLSLIDPDDGKTIHIPVIHLHPRKIAREIL